MTRPAAQPPVPKTQGAHLILYDGVCGLCSRFNQFVIGRDDQPLFHFASLQSTAGVTALAPFGNRSHALTTFYVIVDYRSATPVQLSKSRAALFVLTNLGWPWRAAAVCYMVPRVVADRVYDLVARHRYRMFGRHDVCAMPDPAHRNRFIE